MHIILERVRSIYLCLYCSLILSPTALLALLEYCGLCAPNPVPWLRNAALFGAFPLIVCALISVYRRERHTRKESQ